MNKNRKKTKIPLEYQVESFFKEVLYLSNELTSNNSNTSKKILDTENIDLKALVYEEMKQYENLINIFKIKALRENKSYKIRKRNKRKFKIKDITNNKTDISNFQAFENKSNYYNEFYKFDKNDDKEKENYYIYNNKSSNKNNYFKTNDNKLYLKYPKQNTSFAEKRNKSDDKFTNFNFKNIKNPKIRKILPKKNLMNNQKDNIVGNNINHNINPSENYYNSEKFENNETFYSSYKYKNKLKNINNNEIDTSNENYKNKNYTNDKYESSNDIFHNKYKTSYNINNSKNEKYTNDKISSNYTDFIENSNIKPKNRWVKPKTNINSSLISRIKNNYSKNSHEESHPISKNIYSQSLKSSLTTKSLVNNLYLKTENKNLDKDENKRIKNIFYKKEIKNIGYNLNNYEKEYFKIKENKKQSRNYNENFDINSYKTEPNIINDYREEKEEFERILEGKEKLKEAIRTKEENERKRLNKIRKK